MFLLSYLIASAVDTEYIERIVDEKEVFVAAREIDPILEARVEDIPKW